MKKKKPSNSMKTIKAKEHGFLDYSVVLMFLAAPSILHFSNLPALISYNLGGIHLVMTMLADFPMGPMKIMPFQWHGKVEMVVGPLLVALPFALGFGSEPAAQCFFIINGIVIMAIWLLTDYHS
jgi:hypothetical protein